MMTEHKSNIDMFFKDPSIEPILPGRFGVLYLLRRDIRQCINNKILWPGTMAILAGIDLLGKFYAGEDSVGGAGGRFKRFVEKYFKSISPNDAETIYQLRNALMHSFGLYSKTREKEYHFMVVSKKDCLVKKDSKDFYMISIETLYDKFEEAVKQYYEDLIKNCELQEKFNKMFSVYGAILIN